MWKNKSRIATWQCQQKDSESLVIRPLGEIKQYTQITVFQWQKHAHIRVRCAFSNSPHLFFPSSSNCAECQGRFRLIHSYSFSGTTVFILKYVHHYRVTSVRLNRFHRRIKQKQTESHKYPRAWQMYESRSHLNATFSLCVCVDNSMVLNSVQSHN